MRGDAYGIQGMQSTTTCSTCIYAIMMTLNASSCARDLNEHRLHGFPDGNENQGLAH